VGISPNLTETVVGVEQPDAAKERAGGDAPGIVGRGSRVFVVPIPLVEVEIGR
jgi:hypothetical protein